MALLWFPAWWKKPLPLKCSLNNLMSYMWLCHDSQHGGSHYYQSAVLIILCHTSGFAMIPRMHEAMTSKRSVMLYMYTWLQCDVSLPSKSSLCHTSGFAMIPSMIEALTSKSSLWYTSCFAMIPSMMEAYYQTEFYLGQVPLPWVPAWWKPYNIGATRPSM